MRLRRIKVNGRTSVYHCISRVVAGERLLDDRAREVLRMQMWRAAEFCGVRVLTYCLMSNHFHILVRISDVELVSDEELVRRCGVLYGWSDPRVSALEALFAMEGEAKVEEADRARRALLARMHDLSMFMKELKQRFTIWYNRNHERYGTLWAERFKSLLVQEQRSGFAVMTVAAYIDLNAVRAGICQDPKDYRFCGYGEAVGGSRSARAGLKGVVGMEHWNTAGNTYRIRLFGSASWPMGEDRASLDPAAFAEVLNAGGELSRVEILRCRVRYFTDGVALGTNDFVQSCLNEFSNCLGLRKREIGGPRRMKGAAWEGLTVLRGLRKRVFG